MSYELAAKAALKTVRSVYEKGHKSTNKAKGAVTLRQSSSGKIREKFSPDAPDKIKNALDTVFMLRGWNLVKQGSVTYGRCLLNMQAPAAANCMELACMAAAAGADHLGKVKELPIALIQLGASNNEATADHIFCAFGNRPDLEAIEGASLADLDGGGGDIWFVDPWLNVVCKSGEFYDAATDKLDKWLNSNKRVEWGYGPQGAGWYSPVGDYSDCLLNTPIEVSLLRS